MSFGYGFDAFGVPLDFVAMNKGVTPEFFVDPGLGEMVRIRTAGDLLNIPVCPVDDRIRLRFGAEYEAWKAGGPANGNVTLLADWGELPQDALRDYRARGVETVEDLAALTDLNVNIAQGGRAWRAKAQAFLDREDARRDVDAVSRDNEALREMVALLRAELDEMKGGAK